MKESCLDKTLRAEMEENMNTDKGMDLLKRSISVLMLLAVYAIISLTGILSFVLAGIATPIYYFLSIKLSGISYERAKDFITSTLIFCFFFCHAICIGKYYLGMGRFFNIIYDDVFNGKQYILHFTYSTYEERK